VVTVKEPVPGTPQAEAMATLARRADATLVVGVVERQGDRFRNAAVAWAPDGELVDRYEKNQRVPFGEYVPLRAVISAVTDVSAIPRDAIAGSEAGLLATPAGDLGVIISYEVFFPRRARDAMASGAEVLLVPTNASSFTTSQMPTLELGAARLRAIETGRDVLQAAPTGLSGVIRPDGTVVQQSDLGAREVLLATVQRRVGDTPYTRLGDGPFVVSAAIALAAAWVLDRRRRPSEIEPRPA
jgi:apolipoprotein N-acyltransferase